MIQFKTFIQSYKKWNLIIVDSSDDISKTKNILSTLPEESVRYIYVEPKKKLKVEQAIANARNIGMISGESKYIAHLDDDNIFHQDHLAMLMDKIEEKKEVEFIYADSLRIDYHSNPSSFQGGGSFSLKRLLDFNFIASDDVIHSRRLFQQVGPIREDLLFYADWEYWVRMALQTKVLHVPKVLTLYREHPDQASFKLNKDKHREEYQKVKEIIREMVNQNIGSKFLKQ